MRPRGFPANLFAIANSLRYTEIVSARFLDDAARAAFKRAIEAIEGSTSIEVVIAVRRRSARYLHANVIVGAAVAFAGLATMMYASHEFAESSIVIDPFVVGLAAGWLVELLPGLKRVLAPASQRRRHVLQAARATFVERGVSNTRDRSGILVYISRLEQQVALVADSGVARALPPDANAKADAALTAAMATGGPAVAKALEDLIAPLAGAMPRRADDVNELPDAIDSDLERGSR
jgi:putative membrane protein